MASGSMGPGTIAELTFDVVAFGVKLPPGIWSPACSTLLSRSLDLTAIIKPKSLLRISPSQLASRHSSCKLRSFGEEPQRSLSGLARSKAKANGRTRASVLMWSHLLACALLLVPAHAVAGAKEKLAALAPSGCCS
jgi:hypothetical protein